MKRSLIVYGGWDGHQPEQMAHLFADELRADGWKVDLSDSLAAFADGEKLVADYDLLTPIWTMDELPGDSWKGLDHAVRQGVGIAGFHGGMGDAFRKQCDFQFMVGGQFVQHPGNIKRWTVNITAPRDPIMQGIDDFEIESEQYYMHVDPAIQVLASTVYSPPFTGHDWCNGVIMPVAWKKSWGSGRVFYCSLGHTTKDFEIPAARLMVKRGMIWASR